MKYEIELNEEQEKFLELYLSVYPLREEHTKKDYPGIIAKNFIMSMMKRENEIKGIYKDKFGKDFE